METILELQQFANHPIPHFLLVNLLEGYKSPNDKIHDLTKSGFLVPIKKGLYILGPKFSAVTPEPFLIANQIYGPSYISMDSALAHYGMIPEKVFEISSVTTKPSRTFKNSMGIFSFMSLPVPYYSLGIESVEVAHQQNILIASREKALTDKIITSRGLILRSVRNVREYLIENLRIDYSELKELDIKLINSWIPYCPKKTTIKLLIKTLKIL